MARLPPSNCGPYFGFRSACWILTWLQSTSNSSAMIFGRAVLMPCPVSGFLAMIVKVLSGWTVMYVFGASDHGIAGPPPRPPCCANAGAYMPMMHAAAGKRGHLKERATIELGRLCCLCGLFSWLCPPPAVGREVNGFLDSQVGSAAADVAVHRRVDLRVGRLRDLRREGPPRSGAGRPGNIRTAGRRVPARRAAADAIRRRTGLRWW